MPGTVEKDLQDLQEIRGVLVRLSQETERKYRDGVMTPRAIEG